MIFVNVLLYTNCVMFSYVMCKPFINTLSVLESSVCLSSEIFKQPQAWKNLNFKKIGQVEPLFLLRPLLITKKKRKEKKNV